MVDTANTQYALGRHAEALDLREQALAVYRRVLPADHPDIAMVMTCTANSYSELGRHAEALQLHEQVLAVRQRMLPVDHPDIAKAMACTANSYSELGRHAEALQLHEQVLAVYRRVFPADHPDIATANATFNTARSYSAIGRYAEALHLHEQALALFQRVLPADHPDIATAIQNTAACYSAVGRHPEALHLHEQALAIYRRTLPADHPDIACCMFNIAVTLQADGSALAATCGWFAHEALQSLRSRFPVSHHLVRKVVSLIEALIFFHGASAIQPMFAPAADHLRIGRLVRLNNPSAHALNASQGLVFGPERGGLVPVRLLGLREDGRSTKGWGKSVERLVPVGILTEMGLPPALGAVENKSPVSYFCARHSDYIQYYACDLHFECIQRYAAGSCSTKQRLLRH
jgi:tetratricopeptide (TPR) repeat protein